jgi:hypothetical protein
MRRPSSSAASPSAAPPVSTSSACCCSAGSAVACPTTRRRTIRSRGRAVLEVEPLPIDQARLRARKEVQRLFAPVELSNRMFQAPHVSSDRGCRGSFEDLLDVAAADVVQDRFGGLGEARTAEALSLSLRTVQREGNAARGWLRQQLVRGGVSCCASGELSAAVVTMSVHPHGLISMPVRSSSLHGGQISRPINAGPSQQRATRQGARRAPALRRRSTEPRRR